MENRPIKIGLPRAMLYYRYRDLWRAFFAQLGMETVVSPPTDQGILDRGSALAIDEACLSLKVYLGHVAALAGRCDYILVPRISNFGRRRSMCTRFESMPDLVRSVFRGERQKFLSYEIDGERGLDEEAAFLDMGRALFCPDKAVKRAYRRAKRTELAAWRERVRKHEGLCRREGMKVLIAAHSYVAEDPFLGKPVADYLKGAGVVPVRADLVDREAALRRSRELSPTCKWEVSREILGGVAMHRGDVDGIILLSAFPCGPDAMVNEIITRRVNPPGARAVPILNLVLDAQSGAAGMETRLESFIDIIRFKEGTL